MKFKNIALGLFAFASLSLTSCKDENKTETNLDETQQVVPANSTSNTTAALNPAHGQPGHSCEIPVGAPLDGSAATNTNTQVQPQTTTGNTSPVRLNGSTSTATPTKNPPHGQPGHDCAIPVGADLNG
ncbi:hypothetical protein BH23BAC2_BH23BAC2_14420 [soil metagenome]